jgi:hypothetical protein
MGVLPARLAVLVAVFGLQQACAASGPAQSGPSVALTEPGRAPGSLPQLGLPTPRPSVEAPASEGIVALSSPRPLWRVRRVLLEFFAALTAESPEQLATVFEGNAVAHFAGGTSTAALSSWIRRFARWDYRGLSPEAVVDPTLLSVFTAQDVQRLQVAQPFALQPGKSELLVVLNIDGPDASLLGRSMHFVLRSNGPSYRVASTYEQLTP